MFQFLTISVKLTFFFGSITELHRAFRSVLFGDAQPNRENSGVPLVQPGRGLCATITERKCVRLVAHILILICK